MIPIKITLEGPGTTFDGLVLAIQEALAGLDADVTVDNEYPPQDSSLEQWKARHRERAETIKAIYAENGQTWDPSGVRLKVRLSVKHLPWGG